jgi:ubiquitin carboxyl-terminal hydrolase 34
MLVKTLVQTFWAPFVLQLNMPTRQGYSPSDNNRSLYGFAGLKNLGCICYMNSMIQQFFNVPTFRYSLLAADDRQALELVKNSDGKDLDDNSLHQWMRMFSHLEMTDRKEYNPADFCYAFKEPGGKPTNVRVQQDA